LGIHRCYPGTGCICIPSRTDIEALAEWVRASGGLREITVSNWCLFRYYGVINRNLLYPHLMIRLEQYIQLAGYFIDPVSSVVPYVV
jgi:hypothetical protein